jgi:hypothetical protein
MFRTEEEAAQQYFFGYLSLQLVPGKNPDVLAKMNETSTFWITTHYALLMSAFVVLGRIFDQDPKSLHNIDKLLGVVTRDIASLSAAALEQSRIAQGMTPKDAAAYAHGKYDLTMDDVRGMRKAVGQWRKVYEARSHINVWLRRQPRGFGWMLNSSRPRQASTVSTGIPYTVSTRASAQSSGRDAVPPFSTQRGVSSGANSATPPWMTPDTPPSETSTVSFAMTKRPSADMLRTSPSICTRSARP